MMGLEGGQNGEPSCCLGGSSDDGLVVVLVSLYEEEVMMMTAQDRMTLRRGSHDRRL